MTKYNIYRNKEDYSLNNIADVGMVQTGSQIEKALIDLLSFTTPEALGIKILETDNSQIEKWVGK